MFRLNVLAVLAVMLIALMTSACSEDSPSVNVRNDYTTKVNVQLKPAVGNTININDVESGSTTSYTDIVEGSWSASATVQASSAEPAATFNATNDNNYTVVITNTEPPLMQIKVEEK